MRYRKIAGTDLEPSVIGLGTVDMGTRLNQDASYAILDRYLELGGTLVDTAHVYGDWASEEKGPSEKMIGNWLADRKDARERIILSTKGAHPPLSDMKKPRLDGASIRGDLADSLDRLNTDRIDLYWLHRDDPGRPVESIMESLHEHVAAGRIRYIGASNWQTDRIEAANRYALQNGLTPFVGSQPHWNLASLNPVMPPDGAVVDERAYAWYASQDVAVFAYSAQAAGFFSGRYGRDRKPEGGRSASVERMYANEESYARLDRVQELSRQIGASGSQIALAYLTSQPFPVFALIGAGKLSYLEDSCQAGDLVLTPEQLRYLEHG